MFEDVGKKAVSEIEFGLRKRAGVAEEFVRVREKANKMNAEVSAQNDSEERESASSDFHFLAGVNNQTSSRPRVQVSMRTVISESSGKPNSLRNEPFGPRP